ncbi:MAG TPA: hypothetical protein VG738_09540 [Chitinophagaceae bacterium]|nr:hypothetical protein [Chitinophagaceae bacterium]
MNIVKKVKKLLNILKMNLLRKIAFLPYPSFSSLFAGCLQEGGTKATGHWAAMPLNPRVLLRRHPAADRLAANILHKFVRHYEAS